MGRHHDAGAAGEGKPHRDCLEEMAEHGIDTLGMSVV
jgi:hypothetical protein